jgi:arylsulfatase A-like enzyme
MIVRYPALQAVGRVCDLPVISNDLYPTILELSDLPTRSVQHCDGVSLAGLIKGTSASLERPALFWHFPHYSNHGMQSPCAAIRVGDYKLIEYFENNTIQLFNLEADLGELDDISKVEPAKADELRQMLHRWFADVGAQMPLSKQ